jgi:hypothetical protein
LGYTCAACVPATIGELRPLDLDFLAKRMQWPLEGGRVIQDANDVRTALAGGSLKWVTIQEVLEFAGAHPDYIGRVRNALEFSWDGFWKAAAGKYNLSKQELGHLQRMMVKSADLRGMKPVEFVSKVFSPMITAGQQAAIEELGVKVGLASRIGRRSSSNCLSCRWSCGCCERMTTRQGTRKRPRRRSCWCGS